MSHYLRKHPDKLAPLAAYDTMADAEDAAMAGYDPGLIDALQYFEEIVYHIVGHVFPMPPKANKRGVLQHQTSKPAKREWKYLWNMTRDWLRTKT